MDLEFYINKINEHKKPVYESVPANITPVLTKFHGIKVVLCDVYGTIVKGRSNSISDLEKNRKNTTLFSTTMQEFNLQNSLQKIDNKRPDELLNKLYLEGIKKIHAGKKREKIKNPEIKIEEVWEKIIQTLMHKGYIYNKKIYGNIRDLSLKMSYFYQYTNEDSSFYEDAFKTLKTLKRKGIILGLVSNAQFYTPINLNIELMRQSKGKIGMYDMFNKDLMSFSFIVGQSKPGEKIFEKILKNLKKRNIKKNEVVFIGNDLNKDIKISKEIGFKTVLFAGDKKTLKLNSKTKPDAIIKDWVQLLKSLAI